MSFGICVVLSLFLSCHSLAAVRDTAVLCHALCVAMFLLTTEKSFVLEVVLLECFITAKKKKVNIVSKRRGYWCDHPWYPEESHHPQNSTPVLPLSLPLYLLLLIKLLTCVARFTPCSPLPDFIFLCACVCVGIHMCEYIFTYMCMRIHGGLMLTLENRPLSLFNLIC